MISRGTFSKNVVRFGLIDSFLQLNDTSRLVFNYLSNNFEILIYHSSFFLERLISGESNQKNQNVQWKLILQTQTQRDHYVHIASIQYLSTYQKMQNPIYHLAWVYKVV